MNDSQPALDPYTLVILLIALVIGGTTGALTYWAQGSLPESLLAGGAATGAAMLWGPAIFKRPPGWQPDHHRDR